MGTTVAGLEGVVAGESEICYIDGYAGVLSYRGYNIHTLADNASFEEVIYLLWNGWLPKRRRVVAPEAVAKSTITRLAPRAWVAISPVRTSCAAFSGPRPSGSIVTSWIGVSPLAPGGLKVRNSPGR